MTIGHLAQDRQELYGWAIIPYDPLTSPATSRMVYPLLMKKEWMTMDVLNVPEFAQLLGMTQQSLYARRSRDPGSLPPAIRIGRRLVWGRETVEKWLIDLEKTQNQPRRRETPASA